MRLEDAMIGVLRHAGRRPKTEVLYCREVRAFLAWFGANRPLRVRREDVMGYLEETGQRSVSRRKMAHAGLRFFYVHVVNKPEIVQAIPWPRVPRPLRSGPCWNEVRRLLQAVEDPVCQAVLQVIAAAGLRISEACSLRVSDVQSERDERGRKGERGVLLVRGKGGKERYAPLSPTLLAALRGYFVAVKPEGVLFPNGSRQGPISAKAVRCELQRACARVGLKRSVVPHQLRHAFATTMLEQGVDLPTLQAALGHQRLSTTSVYLHVRRDRLAAMPDLLGTGSRS